MRVLREMVRIIVILLLFPERPFPMFAMFRLSPAKLISDLFLDRDRILDIPNVFLALRSAVSFVLFASSPTSH